VLPTMQPILTEREREREREREKGGGEGGVDAALTLVILRACALALVWCMVRCIVGMPTPERVVARLPPIAATLAPIAPMRVCA